ncbi:MAG: hypothetical protein PHI78_05240 [Clostridia bacterium]|nr:hypothetical protein [Clostridia bacterium]
MNEQPRDYNSESDSENRARGAVWNEPAKDCGKNVNTIKILNAINDNALMARESTETILKYVDNMDFGDLLRSQVNKYDEFCRRAQLMANNLGCVLETQNKTARSMAKMSLKMKMLMDNSVGKIAEIMLLGTTNGIVDMGKLIRHTPDVKDEALSLAKELLIYEEDKVELMKYHL